MKLPAIMDGLISRMAPARRAMVLAYHRICDPSGDPDGLAVAPLHFAAHIDVLMHTRRLVHLSGLMSALSSNHEADIVAVTFDDGYLDFLTSAVPILERYNCPATVFLATAAVGGQREFWWDELTRIVLTSPLASARFLGTYWSDVLPQRELSASALRGALALRHVIMNKLWRVEPRSRSKILTLLADHLGIDLSPRGSHRVLSVAELERLAQNPLICFGAHGVTHRPLDGLAYSELRYEVFVSKLQCEKWTGRQITAFAYPFGAADQDSRNVVGSAGYEMAFGINSAAVTQWSDPLMLPRFEIRDWTGDEFANVMRKRNNRGS